MARLRETVCIHYAALGECKKGRDANHKGYSQKCDKYYPRARQRHINMKRKKLETIRSREMD